jgi:tryptophan-rich sensory protein
MAKRFLLFILLNFGALAIGSLFTSDGVASDWYQELNKAPWTPPGWAFGAAWSTIMLCFSAYLAFLWPVLKNKRLFLIVYGLQWLFNVSWNPVFFHLQEVALGLVLINVLTVVVGLFLFAYLKVLRWKSILILPYFLWLIVATSLNAYIYLYNG